MEQEIILLRAAVARLEERILFLEAENAELKRRLAMTSLNSSKAPSSDLFKLAPRPTSLRVKSGKTSGGQVGHKGETLARVIIPDVIFEHKPEKCAKCGVAFGAEQIALKHESRQVFDIPEPKLVVSEHHALTFCCTACQQETKGEFPQNVTAPVQYGANVKAIVTYLHAQQLMPLKRLQQTAKDLLNCAPSEATLKAIIHEKAQDLQGVYEKIKLAVKASPVKHLDETGFRIESKTQWLHAACTKRLSYTSFPQLM